MVLNFSLCEARSLSFLRSWNGRETESRETAGLFLGNGYATRPRSKFLVRYFSLSIELRLDESTKSPTKMNETALFRFPQFRYSRGIFISIPYVSQSALLFNTCHRFPSFRPTSFFTTRIVQLAQLDGRSDNVLDYCVEI